MVSIVQKENPVLREKAKKVSVSDIKAGKFKKIIADMSKALAGQADGVAIAAPQIGVPLRIFVVSGKILDMLNPLPNEGQNHKDEVFINPEIIRSSREKAWVEEGCLSVRFLYGKVYRSKKITLRALNEKGEKVERGASGLLAQIFQHETDHLSGILFTDTAKDLKDLPPEDSNS